MNISVKEFRVKLGDYIAKLGIDKRFYNNPAFENTIIQIENMISQMNLLEEDETALVRIDEDKITFEISRPNDTNYSFRIICASPDSFRCIKTEEKKPFRDSNGEIIKQKSAVEKAVSIDDYETITITTNGSLIDNVNCSSYSCNNTTWAEKISYTPNGVMKSKESKTYSNGELTESVDNAKVESMLYIPRNAFSNQIWENNYDTKLLLVRKHLDTARVFYENRVNNVKYSALNLLKQEHGLKDMEVDDRFPTDVYIPALSPQQIEELISRENNPQIIKGLKEYCVGRSDRDYDSNKDVDFVCEGLSQSR